MAELKTNETAQRLAKVEAANTGRRQETIRRAASWIVGQSN
jgi:hypothetical protein